MSEVKTILFVDDDAAFLQLTGELMQQASQGGWQVIMADNPAEALAALKDHEFHMIVVDERMPVMSGSQFVRLARGRFPNMPIVMLTGHVSEQTRQTMKQEGIDVLLEKPTSSEGFHTLFLTLNELLGLERSKGFSGLMQNVQLQDILQLECLRRNSTVLEVFSKSESGEIIIRTGSVIHAVVGALTGEEAFYHLLNLKDGEFRLKPYVEPAEKTISSNWEMLLMEAAQKRDESDEREAAESMQEPEPAPPSFPAIILTAEEEQAGIRAAPLLLAISAEGRVLAGESAGHEALTTRLAGLLAEAAWFKALTGLGALQQFEARLPKADCVIHFQPESLVFVQQSREAQP